PRDRELHRPHIPGPSAPASRAASPRVFDAIEAELLADRVRDRSHRDCILAPHIVYGERCRRTPFAGADPGHDIVQVDIRLRRPWIGSAGVELFWFTRDSGHRY